MDLATTIREQRDRLDRVLAILEPLSEEDVAVLVQVLEMTGGGNRNNRPRLRSPATEPNSHGLLVVVREYIRTHESFYLREIKAAFPQFKPASVVNTARREIKRLISKGELIEEDINPGVPGGYYTYRWVNWEKPEEK